MARKPLKIEGRDLSTWVPLTDSFSTVVINDVWELSVDDRTGRLNVRHRDGAQVGVMPVAANSVDVTAI